MQPGSVLPMAVLRRKTGHQGRGFCSMSWNEAVKLYREARRAFTLKSAAFSRPVFITGCASDTRRPRHHPDHIRLQQYHQHDKRQQHIRDIHQRARKMSVSRRPDQSSRGGQATAIDLR